MANKSVLQIIRTACQRIGLVAPSTAVGSTDLQVIQLTSLANEEGKELAARYPWSALTREATFTSVALEDQGLIAGGIVAAGEALRNIANDTIWDRTQRYPLAGPTSGPRWQAEKAFGITGPYARYRIRNNHLYMLPAPAAGKTLAFEYQTENWVSNVAGTTFRDEFTLDDDFPILDSNVITAGVVWRFKQAKGLEYSQDFQKYELSVADLMARDGTKPTLSLNGPREANFQPFVTIPLTNWNQP